MKMYKLASILAVAILPAAYSLGDRIGASAPPLAPPAAQGLSLTESRPEAITGWFRKDDRAIQFAMARDPNARSLLVKNAQGEEIVYLSYEPAGSTLRYLGGENIAGIDSQPPEDLDIRPEQQRNILALLTNEDVGLLPWLSRALGEQGMTGKDYPVTFSLHNLASKVVASALSILKIRVPSLRLFDDTKAHQGGFSCKKSILFA